MKLRVGERIGAWRRDRLAGSLLVLLSLGLWWVNRAYPVGTIHEPGPGFMPLVLAVILAIAGVAVMKFGGDERLRDTPWTEVPRVFTILAACGVAMLIFQHAGYRLTVGALLVFLLGVLERRRAVVTGSVAIAFPLVSFYVVGDVLGVPLPRGPFNF